LGGTFGEYLTNPSDDGKEYANVVVGRACLVLMRRAGIGSALGAGCRDLPLLVVPSMTGPAERRAFGPSRQ